MNFAGLQNIIYELLFKIVIKKWIKRQFIPHGYKFSIDCKEIKAWCHNDNMYFKNLNDLKNNSRATKEELFELDSFDYYQGNVGVRMNNVLRGVNPYLDEIHLHEYIKIIENTINRFKVKDNIVTLRRTSANLFNKKNKGSTFKEFGFLSTSINLFHRVDSEGNHRHLKNEALLILKIPKNTNALYIEEVQPESRRRKEHELLIQKESILIIEENYKIFSNRIILATVFQM
jgi:hypothetical protein